MAATFTTVPDGDVSFGNWRGQLVDMTTSTSDYPTGGYPFIDGVAAVDDPTLASSQNVSLYRLLVVEPVSGQGGYVPEYDSVNNKLIIRQQNGSTGQLVQVPANTDFSARTFRLLLKGI